MNSVANKIYQEYHEKRQEIGVLLHCLTFTIKGKQILYNKEWIQWIIMKNMNRTE